MTSAQRPKQATSERRKQQNRQAQKNYRDRQNRRLRNLEALVESREVASDKSVALEGHDQGFDQGFAGLGQVPDSSVDVVLGHAEVATQSRPRALRPAVAGCRSPKSSSLSILAPPSLADHDVLIRLLQEDNRLDEVTRHSIISGALTVQDVLKAGLDALFRCATLPEAPLSTVLPSPSNASPAHGPSPRTDQIYIIENRMQEHAHSLPHVRANGIRIKQLCGIAAIRRNAEMLGIAFEELSNEQAESPLHDPSVAKGAEKAVCAAKFQHVSPDLRPTAAQIRYRHHPWIDMIPSPTLRQRLLECISMEPPMVDQDNFCSDLENDGLICWGSTREDADLSSGSGAPWNVRSWEAQPWFLRKWWFLLGGCDGELFQASKWWHELRGDHLSYAWQ